MRGDESIPSPDSAFFGPGEDLHPDLEPWIVENDTLGRSLKHPLVYSIMHHPRMNHMVNSVYKQKTEMLDRYKTEENWSAILFACYERPYRLHAFQQIEGNLSDMDYWRLLGAIWTDSENIWQCEDDWLWYLSSERANRELIMDEEERTALQQLPDRLTIHRGFCREGREQGLSWSLDREKAIWFARRFAGTTHFDAARLATATIEKARVVAHFTGRGESEIVALPEHIHIHRIEEV